jgi:hypothetical protein
VEALEAQLANLIAAQGYLPPHRTTRAIVDSDRVHEAAVELFAWLASPYALDLRRRMRNENVLKLQLGPYVDSYTGKTTNEPHRGCVWMCMTNAVRPTLRIESLASILGGPWYEAHTPAQAIRGRSDFNGQEAAIIATARALNLIA